MPLGEERPDIFTFAEVLICTYAILIPVVVIRFNRRSCWSFDIREYEFWCNKLLKKIKIMIWDIKMAEFKITVNPTAHMPYDSTVILSMRQNKVVFDIVCLPVFLQMGEVLSRNNIKTTYELCMPSTESKLEKVCKRFSTREFDKFKSEVFKRLESKNKNSRE